MSTALDLETLVSACSAGGSSCLSVSTELRPAVGEHASIAPAKFAAPQGSGGTYAYEQRFAGDDGWRTVVIVDSKQSTLNRAEGAIRLAIQEGHAVLSRLPRIRLTYERNGIEEEYTDLDLPHRAFDGHFRAGMIDGVPAVKDPRYLALRDATPANALALLEGSPLSLVYGSWDSSRKSRQGRWRSALTGEVIGFCADTNTSMKGGARVDPVAMQVEVSAKHAADMVKAQEEELSTKLATKIVADAKKEKDGYSASPLGLGGIPPSLGQLAGVSCDRIVRSHVLSFATLRQIRFGKSAEGDAACRALLAALALNGLARSYAELYLRANCDLVEAGPAKAEIDRRWGKVEEIEFPDIDTADSILSDALANAESVAGVNWSGQTLNIVGDPQIIAGAADSEDED